MARLKYIMFSALDQAGDEIEKFPIIFPLFIDHDVMKSSTRSSVAYSMRGVDDAKAISAGFVITETWTVSGRSETLNLDSKKEDSKLIRQYFDQTDQVV